MRQISRRAALALGGAFLLLAGRAARAHHGWGSYDAANPVEIDGVIEAIVYEWPHAELTLATDDGTREIVLGPPTRTRSRGLTEDVAVPGTPCTVMGYVRRDRPEEVRVEWVRVNGQTYMMR
jgi:hypothetical protein